MMRRIRMMARTPKIKTIMINGNGVSPSKRLTGDAMSAAATVEMPPIIDAAIPAT